MTMGTGRLITEYAHILFVDIVNYSTQTITRQAEMVNELRHVVEETPEFCAAASRAGDLISLDKGDGLALVYFRDPVSPIQSAVEIAQALRFGSGIELRMGVHTGTVTRSADISGKLNVYGDGINLAQRVMDCGDAGHILLSSDSARVLLRMDGWKERLHDLGEFTIKHGDILHLYNYCDGEIGETKCPERAIPYVPPMTVLNHLHSHGHDTYSSNRMTTALAPSGHSSKINGRLKLALLYKRHAKPDDHVLNLLEAGLSGQGYDVFVDRHLTIGVEWAQEIEKQVRSADAVIPIISQAAVHSEMLAYEIETAHATAQERGGKPRILPIRVNFHGPLPDTIEAILKPIQYSLWESEEDDVRLLTEILHALEKPPASKMSEPLEAVGGAVPLDSKFYITRPVDAEFKTAIARQDSIVLVKGARQMGKTSLLARGLQQAREAGSRVVFTDFQSLDASDLESEDTYFMALARSLKLQLELDVSIKRVWDEDLSPNMNMEWFLRRHVLGSIREPIVWGMDEVDRLFTCNFGSAVFGLFRSWHNKRALDPSGPWSRLTLVMAYATEAHLFISDINQSPFNVGTRLALEDFTLAQVEELNYRYGEPLKNPGERSRFFRLLSGQPYLVRRGLDIMVSQGMSLDTLEAQADRDEGLFGDHLRRILVLLSNDDELVEVVRTILRGQPCPDPDSFYRLRSAGVMAGDSAHDMHPRCQLYASYLTRHLL